ncbi:hypothetical protein I2I11_05565 [Pontibacter sp. 172403-2]|uniref:hypothetical protein n=1 Tax=Pontibacter rufus TaxID=2791028 RepID=UPI0018B00F3A|nr:hypothetical protein [Pontibacter sp. 172403-2]MBF9252747.1 hypothetical protein [Pontibacter sp. 172403-2]
MKPTLKARQTRYFILQMALAVMLLASCNQATEQEVATTEQATEAAAADTVQRRPAPAFYLIPPNLVRERVWICDAATADIFHTKADCPVLLECRGKGNFRNVSLQRAIEEYGRYNCQTCSKDLDHIFDEDMVR